MKEKYIKYIHSDLYRYTTEISKKLIFKNLLINPGFKYMYAHRKYNYYEEKKYKISYVFL